MLARCAASAALVLSLTLAGCSTPGSVSTPSLSASAASDLSTVSVGGAAGAAPTLTLKTPFTVEKTTKRQLTAGTGTAAALGKRVTIDYIGYNGTDGKPFDSSYGDKPRTFLLTDTGNIKGLVDSLVGASAGSRLLIAIPPQDAYGLQGRPAAGIGPTDTLVLVVDVRAVKDVLTRATGDAVAAKAGLPTVKLDKVGSPIITVPKSTPPTTLVVQPLIVGKGAKVAKGQQVTVNYTGVIWPGGKQFDTSWGRTPSTFEIGTGHVIAGWDRALVGQTIGSQLLLVIPPDDGYGAEGRADVGISGTDTLVFVVDILDAA